MELIITGVILSTIVFVCWYGIVYEIEFNFQIIREVNRKKVFENKGIKKELNAEKSFEIIDKKMKKFFWSKMIPFVLANIWLYGYTYYVKIYCKQKFSDFFIFSVYIFFAIFLLIVYRQYKVYKQFHNNR